MARRSRRTTFSEECRRELAAKHPKDECCVKAELEAFLRSKGFLHIGFDSVFLEIQSTQAFLARRLFKLLKRGAGLDPHVVLKRGAIPRMVYLVRASLDGQVPLERIAGYLARESPSAAEPGTISRKCCRRSYLRASFLGGGSIADPALGAHHLEIRARSMEDANLQIDFLSREGVAGRATRRRSDWVVYVKEADEICRFLCVVGAYAALLRYEESRVLCQLKGDVNRVVNCETANLNRTVEASLRQIADIGTVDEMLGLERMPPGLKPLVDLRLKHPHLSFAELGQMLHPKLTKSGVNHRFRQLAALARKLRQADQTEK